MKHFTIDRSYIKDRTIGRFTGMGLDLVTLELPWFFNKRNQSCIPEGTYLCSADNTGKHQWFKINNVVGRDSIEVHIGNYIKNTKGCPLIGLKFDEIHNVMSSEASLKLIKNTVGDEDFILTIKQGAADMWL